jgi:hypothetical protein
MRQLIGRTVWRPMCHQICFLSIVSIHSSGFADQVEFWARTVATGADAPAGRAGSSRLGGTFVSAA